MIGGQCTVSSCGNTAGVVVKFKIIISITAFLFLVACNFQSKTPVALDPVVVRLNPQSVPNVPGDQITFKMVQDHVLKTNCVMCHANGKGEFSNRGDVNLETYASVIENLKAVRDEVSNKEMPPPKDVIYAVSDAQIKFLLDWIDNGAKEEISSPAVNLPPPVVVGPPPVVAEPIPFKLVMEKVISPNCLKCHSESGQNKGDVNLETYEKVFENRFEVKSNIEDGSMPNKKGTPLTDEQKELILDWLTQGSLNP